MSTERAIRQTHSWVLINQMSSASVVPGGSFVNTKVVQARRIH